MFLSETFSISRTSVCWDGTIEVGTSSLRLSVMKPISARTALIVRAIQISALWRDEVQQRAIAVP